MKNGDRLNENLSRETIFLATTLLCKKSARIMKFGQSNVHLLFEFQLSPV